MDTTAPEEARFVRRAVSGDRDAFARLYDAYADRIYRFVFFRVGDAPTAEDLCSQVFLKAWENLDNYQMRGLPFGAWLFRIARNTVIDYYRKYRASVPLEASPASNLDPAVNLDEAAERHWEADQLRAALQQLTEEQRQVLTLKFIDGMSTEEVAQVLGKRCGAVRALQMRGLQALQKYYAALAYSTHDAYLLVRLQESSERVLS